MAVLLSESVIPACEGRAYEVRESQVLRVIAHEGKQVADLTFFNLHNHAERFDVNLTASFNGRQFRTAESLYTNPPFYNVAFTVEHDQYGFNWLHGRCNPKLYERRGASGHRSCQDNIVEALKLYGIPEEAIPTDTFNVFMAGETDMAAHYTFPVPPLVAGDYLDLRAHIDALVAISACPSEDEVNDFAPKAVKIEIWDG